MTREEETAIRNACARVLLPVQRRHAGLNLTAVMILLRLPTTGRKGLAAKLGLSVRVIEQNLQRLNSNGWVQMRLGDKKTGKESSLIELSPRGEELFKR